MVERLPSRIGLVLWRRNSPLIFRKHPLAGLLPEVQDVGLMKIPTLRHLLVGAALLIGSSSLHAQAAYSDFLSPAFSGSTSTDGWFNLNSTTYPGYGTFGTATAAWPAPIGSDQIGSGDASLDKLAGTSGYLGGPDTNAIYSPDIGTFTVADGATVSGLSNILIQVSSTGNLGPVGLTLDYNEGTQNLAPTFTKLISSEMISTPFGPASNYIWAYQWDVSSLGITSFSADWSTVAAHNLTYGARLDQSSTFVQVVPEPSTCVLMALGLGSVFLRRHRSATSRA